MLSERTWLRAAGSPVTRPAESAQAWQQVTVAAPRFAQYQTKTDRELPIIRLVPRSAPEAPPG